MLALLSPAKSLDFSRDNVGTPSEVRFPEEIETLVNRLRKEKTKGLEKLFGVSQKIAELNVSRFQNFSEDYTDENSRQAIFAFNGDVYRGFDAGSLNKNDLKFAQKSVRILSGLYGLIRPMDLIQAYRLEMGTRLKIRRKNNLYEFWGEKITDLINEDLKESKSKHLINLASNEYYKSVKPKLVNAEIIDVNFKEYRGDQLKIISFSAKKARGLMARYMVKERAKNPQDLKAFNYENYSFSEEHSTDNSYLFVR